MSGMLNSHDILRKYKFFAYSGDDGDLYRKNGLKGYRISVYPDSITIESKAEKWRGHQYWDTIEHFDVEDGTYNLNKFEASLKELITK